MGNKITSVIHYGRQDFVGALSCYIYMYIHKNDIYRYMCGDDLFFSVYIYSNDSIGETFAESSICSKYEYKEPLHLNIWLFMLGNISRPKTENVGNEFH